MAASHQNGRLSGCGSMVVTKRARAIASLPREYLAHAKTLKGLLCLVAFVLRKSHVNSCHLRPSGHIVRLSGAVTARRPFQSLPRRRALRESKIGQGKIREVRMKGTP